MFQISDDFPCLQLQDLEELAKAPFDPVVIDPTVVGRFFTTEGFSCCFNQPIELSDYIDSILSRRYPDA